MSTSTDMDRLIRQAHFDRQNRRNGVDNDKPRGGQAGAGTHNGRPSKNHAPPDMNRLIRIETGRKGLYDY